MSDFDKTIDQSNANGYSLICSSSVIIKINYSHLALKKQKKKTGNWFEIQDPPHGWDQWKHTFFGYTNQSKLYYEIFWFMYFFTKNHIHPTHPPNMDGALPPPWYKVPSFFCFFFVTPPLGEKIILSLDFGNMPKIKFYCNKSCNYSDTNLCRTSTILQHK